MAQMIVHGVFDRFPSLKFYFAELNACYLPAMLFYLDRNYHEFNDWFNVTLKKEPSQYVLEHALFGMIGDAPVLKHASGGSSIAWNTHGYYTVLVPSSNGAEEEVHIAPHPDDFQAKWQEQRLRLLRVIIRQQGAVLYDAELDGHEGAPSGKERVDPDGIDPPLPPIGGTCGVELPRRLRVSIPEDSADVLFFTDRNGSFDLYAQPTAGGPARPLSATPAWETTTNPTPARAEARGSRGVVYYALGGGHGHALRGLALLTRLGYGTILLPDELDEISQEIDASTEK